MNKDNAKTQIDQFRYINFLFLWGSILGWCLEVVFRSICHGALYIPGFLLGPYCPIYGFGVLIITYLCNQKSKLVAYLKIFMLSSLLEFVVSFVFEALFHEVLWDYSMLPLSIGTRVSLLFSMAWGMLGLFALIWLEPRLHRIYDKYQICSKRFVYIGLIMILFDMIASILMHL